VRKEPLVRLTRGGTVIALLGLLAACSVGAQTPAPGDSLTAPGDSLTAPGDSLTAPGDSLTAPGDTSDVVAPDLAAATADTLAAPPVPDFWDTGISGTTAVLMTPVMPGWGQLHAENGWRAALAFGIEWYYWSNLLASDRKATRVREFSETLEPGESRDFFADVADEYWEQMRDYAWWSGGILLIITLDAYVGANLYNFEEESLPVPNRWDEHFPPDLPEPIGSRAGPTLTLWSWHTGF
jgi:hypothetical protein